MIGNNFATQVKCFHLIGQHRSDLMIHPNIWRYFNFFGFLSILVSVLSETYFIVENHRNVLASAESFGTLSTEIITLTKLITFIASKEKFYRMIEKLGEITWKCKLQNHL